MTYSPGDLYDKCSILQIKKEKGLEVPEFEFVWEEVDETLKNNEMLKQLYEQLVKSNTTQFELEDLIRVEKKMNKVGEIALLIREFNDRRVALKNRINKELNYTFQEVKCYKRKE